MKKFLAICIILILAISFAACDQGGNEDASLTPTLSVTGTPNNNLPANTPGADATSTPESTAAGAPVSTPTNTPVGATPTPNHQHSWGEWQKETKAFIGKDGTDKRICSTCQASETRPRTANAISNSLYCFNYQYVLSSNNNVSAFSMVSYACCEFSDYAYKPTPIATIIAELKKHFNVNAQLEADLIEAIKVFDYDAQKDEVTLTAVAESGDFILKGYKHLGGNKYETYYSFSGFDIFENLNELYKIEIEYNRKDGNPNKFLSVVRIDALPSDMTLCPQGDSYEYN